MYPGVRLVQSCPVGLQGIALEKYFYPAKIRGELILMEKLTQYLNEKTIRAQIECKDWEEAVREAGKILLANGGVESSYIDGMVKYIKQFGPYVVLLPGFALAHARPEDGAKKVAMSLITLKNPVSFGHEDYDPVYVIMGLAAPAAERHVEVLADICNILKDEETLDVVKSAKDAKEIMEVFAG